MVGFGIKFIQVVFFISASYAAFLGIIVTFFALSGIGKVDFSYQILIHKGVGIIQTAFRTPTIRIFQTPVYFFSHYKVVPLTWMHFKKPSPALCFYVVTCTGLLIFVFYIPALIWLTCENEPIVGLIDASGSVLDPIELESSCNIDCSCTLDKFIPICGDQTWFSLGCAEF